MNKFLRTFCVITAALGLSASAVAQKPAKTAQKPPKIGQKPPKTYPKPKPTTAVMPITVRINSLQRDTARINREIIAADRLRNRRIPGVSPLTMDSINRAQDSICLDLRSRRAEMLENLKRSNREKAKKDEQRKRPEAAQPKK